MDFYSVLSDASTYNLNFQEFASLFKIEEDHVHFLLDQNLDKKEVFADFINLKLDESTSFLPDLFESLETVLHLQISILDEHGLVKFL